MVSFLSTARPRRRSASPSLLATLGFLLVGAASASPRDTTTLVSNPDPDPLIVKTTSGPVRGYIDNTTIPTIPLRKWYGIRYADDTSGENRWKPPRAVFNGTLFDAREFGPACMQGRADGGAGTSVQSEDCLRINVVAPIGAEGLPVYLYS